MALFGGNEFNSLDDLFVNQIEDLYDAENRLTKALTQNGGCNGFDQFETSIPISPDRNGGTCLSPGDNFS